MKKFFFSKVNIQNEIYQIKKAFKDDSEMVVYLV